jgi:molybdopterin-guanine dinucleotide biosynthesis protein A
MAEQHAILAILAGGRGERLGGEKAMVTLGGRALIEHPLDAARGAGLETVVLAKRSSTLPPLGERVLHEPASPRHPLCGVAVLLLACDMPFVTSELLGWLAGLEGSAMTVVGGRPQPLLARYLPEQLPVLRAALDARRALRAVLAELAPRTVDERELARFGSPERMCFNVNDADDLALAESWLP